MTRFVRTAGALLLAAYGAIALLGHGGMHAVQDLAGVAHSHGPGHLACGHDGAKSHVHACGHHHHHHGHDHAGEDEGSEPDRPLHGPGHDHDNCQVCHHFAAGALIDVVAPEVAVEELGAYLRPAMSRLSGSTDKFALPIRGPPCGAC